METELRKTQEEIEKGQKEAGWATPGCPAYNPTALQMNLLRAEKRLSSSYLSSPSPYLLRLQSLTSCPSVTVLKQRREDKSRKL